MKLKRGVARYAALVIDLDRAGLNFLLCRGDNTDLYGHWVPLRATISALVDPRKMPPRPEPFGFEQGELRDVAIADSTMHVFRLDYPEVSPGEAFLHAALRPCSGAIRRRSDGGDSRLTPDPTRAQASRLRSRSRMSARRATNASTISSPTTAAQCRRDCRDGRGGSADILVIESLRPPFDAGS